MIVSLKQITQGITVQLNAYCNGLKLIHIVYCEILTWHCSAQFERNIHYQQPLELLLELLKKIFSQHNKSLSCYIDSYG